MSIIKQLKIGLLPKNHENSTFSFKSCVNRYLQAITGAGSGTETQCCGTGAGETVSF